MLPISTLNIKRKQKRYAQERIPKLRANIVDSNLTVHGTFTKPLLLQDVEKNLIKTSQARFLWAV